VAKLPVNNLPPRLHASRLLLLEALRSLTVTGSFIALYIRIRLPRLLIAFLTIDLSLSSFFRNSFFLCSPGTVALREIRRYQKSTELLIRKLP
jgi:hypothetical protein